MFETVVLSEGGPSSAWWGGGCGLSDHAPAAFLCSSSVGGCFTPPPGCSGPEGCVIISLFLFVSVLWTSPVNQPALLPKQLELTSPPPLASPTPVWGRPAVRGSARRVWH